MAESAVDNQLPEEFAYTLSHLDRSGKQALYLLYLVDSEEAGEVRKLGCSSCFIVVESFEHELNFKNILKRLRNRFESAYRAGRINNPSGWIYRSCSSIIEKNLGPTQPFKSHDSLNVSTYN